MKWISVKERLPKLDVYEYVLFWDTRDKGCFIGRISDSGEWESTQWHELPMEYQKHSDVTHWMPLPEAPDEVD